MAQNSPKPLNIRSEASTAELHKLCDKMTSIKTFTPNVQIIPWIFAKVPLGTPHAT